MRNSRALDGRHSWPLRRRSTAEVLQRLDADIVGLLEVYAGALRYLLRSLREYEAVGAGRGRRGGGERCPVLVRSSRFRVLDASTRWFGTTPDAPGTRLPGARSPRVATVVRLHALDVANTHLDERLRENRRASLTQLAGWVEPDHPTIVMGDFNTTPDDDAAFAVVRASGLRPALD
ncbi:MAG: endonuclease/exonuclease/phosphatase family protein, partial [Acidimicrobiales bacterium]